MSYQYIWGNRVQSDVIVMVSSHVALRTSQTALVTIPHAGTYISYTHYIHVSYLVYDMILIAVDGDVYCVRMRMSYVQQQYEYVP